MNEENCFGKTSGSLFRCQSDTFFDNYSLSLFALTNCPANVF